MIKVCIFSFLLILVNRASNAQLFSTDFSDCPGMDQELAQYYHDAFRDGGALDSLAETEDVEDKARTDLLVYKSFCKDEKLVRKAMKRAKKFTEKGYESVLKNKIAEMRRISGFKSPELPWGSILYYSKKLGRDPYDAVSKSRKEHLFALGKKNERDIANNCSDVDLRSGFNGEPPRDQDGIGWCYAYSAADLLSFKLGKNISAFDIANTFNDQENLSWFNQNIYGVKESDAEGGWIKDSIDYTLKKGLCLEDSVRSSDFRFAEVASFIEALRSLEKDKAQNDFVDCSKINRADWRQVFPELSNSQVVDVLYRAGKNEILREMIKEGCHAKRIRDLKIKTNMIRTYNQEEKHKILSAIDGQLNNQNIIGISYYSSILRGPLTSLYGEHASTIVGRRYNKSNRTCEYLVRNTWGDSCSGYYKNYECEKGNAWIPRNQIAKGVFRATYLE